jgi:hypothetical protein
MPLQRALGVCLAALALSCTALAKEIEATTCGKDRCRTATNGISGIGTLPGAVPAPRSGRFYTIELQGPYGWKIVYEARRGLVRAADFRARVTMGRRWARLEPELRPAYARAVRGLTPLLTAPAYRG